MTGTLGSLHGFGARVLLAYAVALAIWGTYRYFRNQELGGGFRASYLIMAGLTALQGLLGLATTSIDLRARIAAGAAGLLLAATLTPVPYIITSVRGEIDQSLLTSLAAAVALVSVGLTLRRPTAPSGRWIALGLRP